MPQDKDEFDFLRKEIEDLRQQNTELKSQLTDFKKVTEDIKELREKDIINRITEEVKKKVWIGLGFPGAVTVLSVVIGVYAVFSNIQVQVTQEVTKKDNIDKITKELTNGEGIKILQDKTSRVLAYAIKNDTKTWDRIVQAIVDKLLQNKEFVGRINEPSTVAISQKSGEGVLIVAASSENTNELIGLFNKAKSRNLTAYICPPKHTNKRSVLLVAKANATSKRVPSDEIKEVLAKAKQIDSTAYPIGNNDTFFDLNSCYSPSK